MRSLRVPADAYFAPTTGAGLKRVVRCNRRASLGGRGRRTAGHDEPGDQQRQRGSTHHGGVIIRGACQRQKRATGSNIWPRGVWSVEKNECPLPKPYQA